MAETPQDPTLSFEQLYAQARESRPLLEQTGTQILRDLQTAFPGKFDDARLEMGPLKSRERALAKINGDYLGDHSKITDLVRARIVLKTEEQVQLARNYLHDRRQSWGVQKFKDRFAVPSDTNYRDVLTTMKLGNGHVAEMRFEHEFIIDAGNLTHAPYERVQEIERANIKGQASLDDIAESHVIRDRTRDTLQHAADLGNLDPQLSATGREKLQQFDAERVIPRSRGYYDAAATEHAVAPAAQNAAANAPPADTAAGNAVPASQTTAVNQPTAPPPGSTSLSAQSNAAPPPATGNTGTASVTPSITQVQNTTAPPLSHDAPGTILEQTAPTAPTMPGAASLHTNTPPAGDVHSGSAGQVRTAPITPPTGHTPVHALETAASPSHEPQGSTPARSVTRPIMSRLSAIDVHAGRTVGRAGIALGAAQTAIALRQGDYVAAAQRGTVTALSAAVSTKAGAEAVGRLAAKVLPSALRVSGEEIPVAGALVAGGYAVYDIGSSIYGAATGKNSWRQVGTTAAANGAEIAGGLLGFGAGQAARQSVVELSKASFGAAHAPADAAIVGLSKDIYYYARGTANATARPDQHASAVQPVSTGNASSRRFQQLRMEGAPYRTETGSQENQQQNRHAVQARKQPANTRTLTYGISPQPPTMSAP